MPSTIADRVDRLRTLATDDHDLQAYYEATALAESIVHDTVGSRHSVSRALQDAGRSSDWTRMLGACRAVVTLYDQGLLQSPVFRIAHEIDDSLLDIAQDQANQADQRVDEQPRQTALAIAAFLAGAALEDGLRRLCTMHGIPFDPAKSKISVLVQALYQPTRGIEHITASDVKHITAWGDTRNEADHGHFHKLSQANVVAMIMGVRSFLARYLP